MPVLNLPPPNAAVQYIFYVMLVLVVVADLAIALALCTSSGSLDEPPFASTCLACECDEVADTA